MLKKMLKHEWKATWKLLALLNIVTIALALFGRTAMIFEDRIPPMVVALYMIFFIIVLIASGCISFVLLVVRYYRNLYTDEGYLTNTLPVSSACRLNAKLLNFLAWTLLNVVSILISVLILASTSQPITVLISDIGSVLVSLPREMGVNAVAMWLVVFGLMILGTLSSILMFYFSISVGCCFNTHKVVASVVTFFITYTVLQVISLIMVMGFGMAMFSSRTIVTQSTTSGVAVTVTSPAGSVPQNFLASEGTFLVITMLFLLVLCVAFYFSCKYLLEKKLNLN